MIKIILTKLNNFKSLSSIKNKKLKNKILKNHLKLMKIRKKIY